ncbi:MAG TPA: type II CAAX endopeptidase family protein [Bacteroidia bacterium]|nr:type II CAAX endopeptidase family protein [Bacteroidia bacterium]
MLAIPNTAKRSTLLWGILLLLLTLFVVAVFARPMLFFLLGTSKINLAALWIDRLFFWICLLLIFLYSFFIEKQQFLILGEKKYDFWIYIVSVFAIYAALFAGLFFISKTLIALKCNMESEMLKKLMVIFRAHKSLMIFTALTAGFVEELTFRGYLLPRLAILLKSPGWAIVISSVLFGLMHMGYGTIVQVAAPFFIGLVFAFYYWEFRNIKVLIFCHCAWDLLAMYVKL